MAGLIHTALRRLLPGGRAFRLTGQASNMLDGLADSLCRPRLFLRNVQAEALPATASATIDQWLDLLGISVPAGTTLGDKRKIAAAELTATGGQSLEYINGRLQAIFPNVYVEESEDGSGVGPFTFYYYVRGFYPYASDFLRILSILARIAPLHLVPVYDARSVYDGDVARCRIASTGRAICGRRETAYTPTDGQVARTGVGVSGIAVTGRIPA